MFGCLAWGCGPSTIDDDSGPGSTGGTTEASTAGPSTSLDDGTTAPPGEATGTTDTTGVVDGSTSLDETTGTTGEPLGCFETNDPGDDECCPERPRPCPVVQHTCVDEAACADAPFADPVVEPMDAQCMLAALAEGSPAVLEQDVDYGFGGSSQQWLVGSAGDVILVRTDFQDFSFDLTLMACQLADAGVLSACASENDPAVLSDCLGTAVEGCEPIREAACPP